MLLGESVKRLILCAARHHPPLPTLSRGTQNWRYSLPAGSDQNMQQIQLIVGIKFCKMFSNSLKPESTVKLVKSVLRGSGEENKADT